MSELRTRTGSRAAGFDFVLSDESVGRDGLVIKTDGWDLRNFRKNPIALFGHDASYPVGRWENIRIDGDRLIGTLKLAKRGTSARIDELISLVEQDILRAVSVGFRITDRDGAIVNRAELHEVSLVSVPALPSALAMARSLNISDDTLSLVFGEHATRDGMVRRGSHGEHAANTTPVIRKNTMKTLSERIEDAQAELVRSRDRLVELNSEDALDLDAIEELNQRIEGQERALAAMKASEAKLMQRSDPAAPAMPAVRRPLSIKPKEPKPEDLIVRAAVVHTLARVTGKPLEKVLEERYPDHEATDIIVRAAVSGATTTQAGWAAELVETATTAFLETLRPISVFPRLRGMGASLDFGPGRASLKVPSRATTPSISGSFVAEGSPIPVRRLGLTSITLTPHKMGVISYFSRELAMYSTPQIEGLLRTEIAADTAATIDALLFDNVAGSTTRPAGLLNGVTPITASDAGGYAAILEDLEAILDPFDTANAGRNIALIMNPKQARRLRMTPGPDGTFGWVNDLMGEVTPIASTSIAAGTVIAVDAADFVSAAGDAPEFDVSEQAVIHAEDTNPQQISTAGSPNAVAAPVVSMYQTAQIAIRMLLDVTWAMRRTGMVQVVNDVTWGDAPETP